MPDTPATPPKPSVQFDWTDWLPYVEDSDRTDDQKREMIETLWSIVLAFVDLQMKYGSAAKESCGQSFDHATALSKDMVQLQNITHQSKEAS